MDTISTVTETSTQRSRRGRFSTIMLAIGVLGFCMVFVGLAFNFFSLWPKAVNNERDKEQIRQELLATGSISWQSCEPMFVQRPAVLSSVIITANVRKLNVQKPMGIVIPNSLGPSLVQRGAECLPAQDGNWLCWNVTGYDGVTQIVTNLDRYFQLLGRR